MTRRGSHRAPLARHATHQRAVEPRELLRSSGVVAAFTGPALLASAIVLVLLFEAYPGLVLIGAGR